MNSVKVHLAVLVGAVGISLFALLTVFQTPVKAAPTCSDYLYGTSCTTNIYCYNEGSRWDWRWWYGFLYVYSNGV